MGLTRKQCQALGIGHLFPGAATGKAQGKGKRKPAHVRGQMNRTERRYAEELEARRLLGEIRGWAFEADTLPLGPEMKFTPDFRVEQLDGTLLYVDVKGGHIWEDATIKIKAAAVLYPAHRFAQARWAGRRWKTRLFRSGQGDRPC